MVTRILIPKLGMGMDVTKLVEWKVKKGDWVERGTIVLSIETAKTSWDVEAETSGYLDILVEEGNEVPVGTLVGVIAQTKAELEAFDKELPKEQPATVSESTEALVAEASPNLAVTKNGERMRISPVARKMAQEHMIDITSIVGTGPGGRITARDIEKAIQEKPKVEVTPVTYAGRTVKSTIPLKGIRETIAKHMHRSLSVSAQLTVMGEIDMTEMMKRRETLVGQEKVLGTRITYTDMLVLVVAKALKSHPIINSSLIDNEIKIWEDINIGVAVGLDDGLIVPVVKNADKKSLVEINQTLRTLAEKARAGKLVVDEVTSGTFTITNLGALVEGYRFETPIINQPESAILGTGRITDRVVARNGQVVIRPLMTYYLTYDHRVINGAAAANFMSTVVKLLENPTLLLV